MKKPLPHVFDAWREHPQVSVVLALLSGDLTIEEASQRASVKPAELEAWVDAFMRAGARGSRMTQGLDALISTNSANDPNEPLSNDLQSLLKSLSSDFLTTRHIDTSAQAAIQKIGEFTRSDACYLYAREGDTLHLRYNWRSDGNSAQSPARRKLPIALIEPLMTHLRAHGALSISDINSDIPAHLETLQPMMRAQGLHTLLNAPLIEGDTILYVLGLGTCEAPRRWTDLDLWLLRFIAHLITETQRRIDAERDLTDSESRVRAFLEIIPDGVWCAQPTSPIPTSLPAEEQARALLNAKVVLCNQQYAQWTSEKTRAKILNLTLRDLAQVAFPLTEEVLIESMLNFVRCGYRTESAPYEQTMGDKQTRWIITYGYGDVVDAHLINVWGRISDVTQAHLAETQRQRVEAMARRNAHLENLSRLTGGIAHDFNNLLMAILGYADIAETELHDPMRVQASLNEIREASFRAANLTSELLTYSQRQHPQRVHMDLNALMTELTPTLQDIMPNDIHIDIRPAPHLGEINADPGHIERLILNICANAREAMLLSGGHLTIETQSISMDEAYCTLHPWAKLGHYALLSISDTGGGIKPENMERIFDPFFTTKVFGKSTGLGLSSVYGIVQQHEGIIQVQSELGIGSTLNVYLPLAEAQMTRTTPAAQDHMRGREERLLVADDDHQVIDIIKRTLERAGYNVVTARDGVEALAIFSAAPERFDLVILDIVMPGLSGIEVESHIRALTPQKPIIFSSGYPGSTIDSMFFESAERVLLTKPYDPEHLLQTVRDVLDRAGATTAPITEV